MEYIYKKAIINIHNLFLYLHFMHAIKAITTEDEFYAIPNVVSSVTSYDH